MLNEYIIKKIIRFKNSSKILKIFFYYHKFFFEKGIGNIGLDFSKKKTRLYIVQDIINKKNYQNYLEIGCFDDELFNHIKCPKKTGVDPVSGGTIRKTSDQFFKKNMDNFDCIFIDGLHEYFQVKKDIQNSLRFLNEGGIILLHDCLPNNYFEQATPRCQWTWNGDVWKAIVEFRGKKEVDVYTINADHGIGVIFKRSNQNLLDYSVSDYKKIPFKEYFKNYKKMMNVIEYEDLLNII